MLGRDYHYQPLAASASTTRSLEYQVSSVLILETVGSKVSQPAVTTWVIYLTFYHHIYARPSLTQEHYFAECSSFGSYKGLPVCMSKDWIEHGLDWKILRFNSLGRIPCPRRPLRPDALGRYPIA